MKDYIVNEIFYSLQGEGMRAGTPNCFVRFAGCNLKCRVETHGFDCDTEFVSGRRMSGAAIADELKSLAPSCNWVIFTGGEPTLQADEELVELLHSRGYKIAIETNGSKAVPAGIDWVTVSPKVAEHAIRQLTANEVKYVRAYGQEIPKSAVKADHYLISPAFDGMEVNTKTVRWCIQLVQNNPSWRFCVQMHKLWSVR